MRMFFISVDLPAGYTEFSMVEQKEVAKHKDAACKEYQRRTRNPGSPDRW